MPAHSCTIAHTTAQQYPHYQPVRAAANSITRGSANSNISTIADFRCSRHSLSLPVSGSANRYPAGRVSGASHGCSNPHLSLPGSHRRRAERAHCHSLSSTGWRGSYAGTYHPSRVSAARSGYSCANCPSGLPTPRRRYTDSGNPLSHQPNRTANATRRANRGICPNAYSGCGSHSLASHRPAYFRGYFWAKPAGGVLLFLVANQ
jgi:hypothetical protein